jgi:4-hydroxy-tetrahydrodipicolinate synthase
LSTDVTHALRGVTAITVTPFDDRGEPDWAGYESVVHRLSEGRVPVITPSGNTSEYYALNRAEWERANEITLKAAGDSLVMPGIGHDLHTASEMAATVARLGAPLAMVHQPVHPHQSVPGWVEYNRRIARSAPSVGFVVYVKDSRIDGDALSALFDSCPNIVGIKYAVADPVRFAEICLGVGEDRVVWACGLAERWAPSFWAVGASGFTSGLVNVVPRLPLDYLDALRRSDAAEAQRLWMLMAPFEQLRAVNASAYNVAVVKEALALKGVCGAAVRPPAGTLSDEQREQVATILATWSEAGY